METTTAVLDVGKIAAAAAAAVAGASETVSFDTSPPKKQRQYSPQKSCTLKAICGVDHIGKRPYMEDRHTIIFRSFVPTVNKSAHISDNLNENTSTSNAVEIQKTKNEHPRRMLTECTFIGVYDGHGGSKAVDFVNSTIHRRIATHPSIWESLGKTDSESKIELEKHLCKIFSDVDDECIEYLSASELNGQF